MKVYCIYDNVRRKFFRSVYDGRDDFTTKPYDISSDKARLEAKAKRLSKESEWKRTFAGPVPRLVVKEFNLTEVV